MLKTWEGNNIQLSKVLLVCIIFHYRIFNQNSHLLTIIYKIREMAI